MASTNLREPAARPATRLVLPLQLGELWVAIDPTHVQELLGARNWMRVPGAVPSLPGILSWRSRAIAVLDLRAVLGITFRSTTSSRTVVARVLDCTFAFFVEMAREARIVDEAAFGAPYAVTGRFVTHQLSLDGRVMPFVDLAAVIDAVSRAPVDRA